MLGVVWKTVRRLLFFLFALFVGVNVVAWVVLNSPPVQRAVVKWVNGRYLAEHGFSLTLESLSLKPFTTAVALEGVALRALPKGDKVSDGVMPERQAKDPRISAASLELRIDALTSWLHKDIVLRSLRIDGLDLRIAYDSAGNLLLPEFPESENDVRIEDTIKRARAILPGQMSLTRSTVTLGAENETRHQSFRIESCSVKNLKTDIDLVPLTLNLSLGKSSVRTPELTVPIEIETLAASAQVANDLGLRVERLEAKTNIGDIEAKGEVQPPLEGRALAYDGTFTGDLDVGVVMAFLELKAQGRMHAEGTVKSNPKGSSIPLVTARLRWNDVVLDGFALYSGKVSAKVEDSALEYSELQVDTPRGARIEARGRVELENSFDFSHKIKATNFPFTELLGGLGLKTDALELLMSTPGEIAIEGAIRSEKGTDFRMKVDGRATFKNLKIPALDDPSRPPLPSCIGDVKLALDSTQVEFKGTELSCRPDESDTTVVRAGNVRFSDGATLFRISTTHADLAWASYFTTGFPTEGDADLEGTITASADKPVLFKAHTVASDVLLYGVRYDSLEGEWGVNESRVFGERLRGTVASEGSGAGAGAGAGASGDAQTARAGLVELDEFYVGFDAQVKSLFRGRYAGPLSALFSAIDSHLPEKFPAVEGEVTGLAVSMEGPLLGPSRWSLHVDGGVTGLQTSGFRSEDLHVFLYCIDGLCKNSKIYAQKISATGGGAQAPDSKTARGYFLADVRELSTGFVNARAVVRSLPLSLDFGERFPLRGVLDARADVIGPWKSWEGSLQVSADALRLGEQDLGAVTVSGFSAGAKEINLVAYARYQQLSLRLRMPHDLKGAATLYARTRGLDLGFILSQGTLAKHNLFTRLDGEVLFSGPAPLTDRPATNTPWYADWQAQGSLSRAAFQYRQLRFALEKKSAFSLSGQVLTVPSLRLSAKGGFVEGKGTYDFGDAFLEAQVTSRVNLGVLQDIFGRVGAADGTLITDIEMSGSLPEVSVTGEARVESGSVALKDYPPPFTNITGEFIFDDDKLEIRRLRAKKGEGELEAAGSINWRPWLDDASRVPALAMRLTARGAQARVPVPFVEFFDTTVDGTLELVGDALPYTLAGEVRVLRAATFRDKSCQDLVAEESQARAEVLRLGNQSFLRLNVQVLSDKGIVLQTACVKSRLSANIKVTGTSQEPVISGTVEADGGQVAFLKSNFVIQRAEFTFDNPVRLDPRLEVQLVSHIESYNVYVSVDGTATRRRTNVWVDPPTTGDGVTLTRSDIFRMLSTGQPPNLAGTQGQALASQVAAYGTSILALDDSLTQAASRLTGGFIDSVQLEPLIENGQTKWRARVSRSLGERLSLGLDIEQGQAVNNQSLNGTVYINDSVNLLGGFDRKSEQTEQYYELSGGLRFQFGSR